MRTSYGHIYQHQNRTQDVEAIREQRSLGTYFEDNRSEAIAQRRIKEAANKHALNQKKHLFGTISQSKEQTEPLSYSPPPIQLRTKIKHESQEIEWEGARGKVGTKMTAILDPTKPVVGTATDSSTNTDIDNLVSNHNEGHWARGHLLNHDLGGFGVPENLFPITAGANAHHAKKVEYPIKAALETVDDNRKRGKGNSHGANVFYQVQVHGDPSHAQFHCDWRLLDEAENNIVGTNHQAVIDSKLRGPSNQDVELDPYRFARHRFKGLKSWNHTSQSGVEGKGQLNRLNLTPKNYIDEEQLEMENGGHLLAIDPNIEETPREYTETELAEIRRIQQETKAAKAARERERQRLLFEAYQKEQEQNSLRKGRPRRGKGRSGLSLNKIQEVQDLEVSRKRKRQREKRLRNQAQETDKSSAVKNMGDKGKKMRRKERKQSSRNDNDRLLHMMKARRADSNSVPPASVMPPAFSPPVIDEAEMAIMPPAYSPPPVDEMDVEPELSPFMLLLDDM